MAKKRRDDELGDAGLDTNPLDSLVDGGFGPDGYTFGDDADFGDEGQQQVRSGRRGRGGEDGPDDPVETTPTNPTTPTTETKAWPTTDELIAELKSNPNGFDISKINFDDQDQVDKISAVIRELMLQGSGANRYEQVLPGDPSGRAAGIYDKTTGQLVQEYTDTSALKDQQNDLLGRLSELTAGKDADYTSALSGMSDAKAKIDAGITDADRESGYGRLDALMGGNYRNTIAGLSGDLDKGISGQDGLSAEEKAMYKRANAQSIASETQAAQKKLNSIRASTGSTMAFLSSADEIRSNIADMRVRQDVELMNGDIARREQNYQAKAERYSGLLQQGVISMQDFEEGLRADRLNSFNAAAKTVSEIASKSQSEISNLTQMADLIYNKLMFEETSNNEAYTKWTTLADSQVAPLAQMLQAILDQATQNSGGDEEE